ncbi:2-keto-4-pentenoate hydratase/2-oxohepta-3-ene-1,7-dioic acid hydratase in catechol pathway [Methylohalomonas lacus]|uniref:2-keto-4-pentenoate hydratase/2-oxohepta-3-ene-1,7-dioic acid hydratase in catechol pathway n=1 Tax=Methylohalomonas lacus TaxID=398773 RepID=A0AAE3HJS1_9GAMM|nr:fumarylacetoacetate hydrolase family protein [Methylohalomonas lacus]MCS3903035.1 2-keto-4-pentenoate hydratase/2-oxohepta-3-ene-1,7-dioic acid hydratase in catechol pathway [Methylohalomonas lacus]
MKLITFRSGETTAIGAVVDDQVVCADSSLPDNLIDFLAAGPAARTALEKLAVSGGRRLSLAEVELLAPVQNPQKFFGVSLNYEDHVQETGLERPEYPTVFNKQSSCIIGPGAAIHRPRVSEKLDYEGELGVVIGKRCRQVPRERAADVVGGYLVVNDVSVRDWQMRSHTWTLGKSFDTHGPIGPWLVTPDEVGNPHALDLKTWVNDERRQSTNTRHLIFDCYDLIEYLSSVMTLMPGDIIATGTSSGVGVKMKPRGYLKPGDTVSIEIDGIGRLSNPVIEEPDDIAVY